MPRKPNYRSFQDEEIAYYSALFPAVPDRELARKYNISGTQLVKKIRERTPIDPHRLAVYQRIYDEKVANKIVDTAVVRKQIIDEGEREILRKLQAGEYGSTRELSLIVSQTQERDRLEQGKPTQIYQTLDKLPLNIIEGFLVKDPTILSSTPIPTLPSEEIHAKLLAYGLAPQRKPWAGSGEAVHNESPEKRKQRTQSAREALRAYHDKRRAARAAEQISTGVPATEPVPVLRTEPASGDVSQGLQQQPVFSPLFPGGERIEQKHDGVEPVGEPDMAK